MRYKYFQIPKRNGDWRIISQPAREVKLLQRVLLHHLLVNLPVHQSATAYVPGVSIKENAHAHVDNNAILKFDLQNFFPSLRENDWRIYCERNNIFGDEEDFQISAKLFFHKPRGSSGLRLAIGAPSSPCLSNILMMDFDDAVTSAIATDKVKYTRYADDLTFSAPRTGFLIIPKYPRSLL
jgi:RNA-directed DNA polymerase